ncbi:MAG: response regulator [Treponema sp.]|nr:response regulator [Treponema sp.]
MTNRKILIAVDSPTMSAVIKNYLLEGNYEVIEATDGISALEKVIDEQPDCIIAYVDLPVIHGYALSRIIKNTASLCSTGVILCSTEDTSVHHFWGTASKADGFYIPAPENVHTLYTLISKAIEESEKRKLPDAVRVSKKNIYEIITNAYDKELFELHIIKNAYQTSNYVFDLDNILELMAKTLAGISNYDSLAIIINAGSFIEYYDHTDILSHIDFNDFKKVCHSDFEKRNSAKKINWKKSKYTENIIETFSEHTEKLKSYEVFPLEQDKGIPLTVHIASIHPNAFNARTIQRLEYFTSVYSILIDKAIMFQHALSAEKKMKQAFSRFIPPKVIEDIISDNSSQAISIGEKRNVAILIADIRNFTKLSEKNSPERVVEFLNSYFSKMGAIIKRHGGTIDKFMGDAIMALFGAPESYKYNGFKAANAALEMMKEIKNLDTSILDFPEDERFTVGIGIHYGKPIVGAIGSEEKKEYTVIGDDVNLASRIESLTKIYGSGIIITNEVKKDIDAAMKDTQENNSENIIPHLIRHLDNVRVKGKSNATHIYELSSNTNKYTEDFLLNYEKALHQYFQKNFHTAKEYFQKAQDINPKDRACFVMLERCKKYQTDIPYDWDGVYTLSEK